MRRVLLVFAGVAGLLLEPGCESSSPGLTGLDAPSIPDTIGQEDGQADADSSRPDTPAGDETVADPSTKDPGPADAVPDTLADAATDRGPDVVQMTLPYPLCQPCRSDLDCQTQEIQAPCLEEGPDARTCGYPCQADTACPDGFDCMRDDVHGRQCRPSGGAACPCLAAFVNAGFQTVCYRQNDLGRCEGLRTCDQPCPAHDPAPETCNGVDDNCDGGTDEGLGTVTCGKGACQAEVPACADGQPQACVPRPSSDEVCDGIDNDCDGEVDQGLGVLTCGTGACQVTVEACIGGRPQPCWPAPSSPETCNGIDDDCNGQVDEGLGLGVACDGPDDDRCATGATGCLPDGSVGCIEPGTGIIERCNGLDDDCDGTADEENCPCPVSRYNGHLYLFCTPTAHWDVARDSCATWGYHLVKIEDAPENTWVVDTAKAANDNEWWIGLNDLSNEGTYVWLDGTAPSYSTWMRGQPNNGGFLGQEQDCVGILSAWNAGYAWNDGECDNQWRFVCEYP